MSPLASQPFTAAKRPKIGKAHLQISSTKQFWAHQLFVSLLLALGGMEPILLSSNSVLGYLGIGAI